MPALTIKSLHKSFGATEVLNDINLSVKEGEFIVFVGPSGCGKSTLLRIVAGLEDVTSGTVSIADKDVTDTPPAKRGIAMVFQSYALYPHLTAKDNMTLAVKQAKLPADQIEQRLERAVKMLSLEQYLERRPSELSGGQRQRVAIGRAIVREPELFLFDEPLSNLDASLRANTRVEIANLHRTLGTTMVYVTHDQIEAMTLADRIVVLNNGRVEQIGTPLDLYNSPANRFVASFIGAPAMNFIDAAAIGYANAATIGIRPENFSVSDSGQLTGTVNHLEKLGAETNLIVKLSSGEILTARLPGQFDYQVDAPITLAFDEALALKFDQHDKRIVT